MNNIYTLENLTTLFSSLYITYSVIILTVYLVASIRLWMNYEPHEKVCNELESNPLVSVVIPAYNEEVSILTSIKSVLNQTYKNIELIVVDDGSTDNTARCIINEYRLTVNNMCPGEVYCRDNIKLITKKNAGKSEALNDAIAMAKGKWILTLDADTVIISDAVRRTLELVRPDVDAVSCFIGVENGNKIHNGEIVTHEVPKKLLPRIQWLEYIRCFLLWRTVNDKQNACLVLPGAYTLMLKDTVVKLGGYKSDILSEDMELTMNMIKNGGKTQFISEFLAWTEVPEKLSSLTKQRLRWYRGGVENLYRYKSMLFSTKRSGFVGFYMLPFLWFADVWGIWVEILGLGQLLFYWMFDIPIEWNLVILSIVIIVSMYYLSMTILVLFIKNKIFKNDRIKLYRVLPIILFEILTYHFINLYWMIRSHLNHYFDSSKKWNKFERQGFNETN